VLGTALLIVQLVAAILSWVYFAAPPGVLSTASVLSLGWGMLAARTR
jgi:hypothetical protein